jgi:hypothetical protein
LKGIIQQKGYVVVEFEYQPWRKIIVHEVLKFPLQNFLSRHSVGVQQGGFGLPLAWAEGIILENFAFRDTDEIIKEKLDGKIHFNSLHYAIMEDYQPEFKLQRNIRIPVMNVGNNVLLKEMARWIKKTFEKK